MNQDRLMWLANCVNHRPRPTRVPNTNYPALGALQPNGPFNLAVFLNTEICGTEGDLRTESQWFVNGEQVPIDGSQYALVPNSFVSVWAYAEEANLPEILRSIVAAFDVRAIPIDPEAAPEDLYPASLSLDHGPEIEITFDEQIPIADAETPGTYAMIFESMQRYTHGENMVCGLTIRVTPFDGSDPSVFPVHIAVSLGTYIERWKSLFSALVVDTYDLETVTYPIPQGIEPRPTIGRISTVQNSEIVPTLLSYNHSFASSGGNTYSNQYTINASYLAAGVSVAEFHSEAELLAHLLTARPAPGTSVSSAATFASDAIPENRSKTIVVAAPPGGSGDFDKIWENTTPLDDLGSTQTTYLVTVGNINFTQTTIPEGQSLPGNVSPFRVWSDEDPVEQPDAGIGGKVGTTPVLGIRQYVPPPEIVPGLEFFGVVMEFEYLATDEEWAALEESFGPTGSEGRGLTFDAIGEWLDANPDKLAAPVLSSSEIDLSYAADNLNMMNLAVTPRSGEVQINKQLSLTQIGKAGFQVYGGIKGMTTLTGLLATGAIATPIGLAIGFLATQRIRKASDAIDTLTKNDSRVYRIPEDLNALIRAHPEYAPRVQPIPTEHVPAVPRRIP